MDKKRIWGRSKTGFYYVPISVFIHLKLFRPLSERVLRRISVQQFSFLYHSPRAAPLQIFCRLSKAASSGCGKQYDRLSGKVITFKKCIDDRRCRVPPDRKLKCSPSSLSLENTGLNGLHKCVFCSLSTAYRSDLSYLLYFGLPVYTNTYV